MHPAALTDDALLAQCDLGRGRASGPGGQHRNKVETAVVLTHRPTGVRAQASERRSQVENKRVALRRLRLSLATEFRTAPPSPSGKGSVSNASRGKGPVPPSPTGKGAGGSGVLDSLSACSDLWRSRRQGSKIVCNPGHRDFPALLAEALDAIANAGWQPAPAAKRLGVSTSQLIKLVKDHPPGFEKWNTERSHCRLHSLK